MPSPPDTLQSSTLEALCRCAASVAHEELHARLSRNLSPAALEQRLAEGLKTLNTLLTTAKGDRHADYLNDPRLQLAYLVHHLPMHAAKVALLCCQVLPQRPSGDGTLRLLDLGAGPLSASLGALLCWPGPAQVLAVDRVGSMMRLGQRALQHAVGGGVEVTLQQGNVMDAVKHARAFAPHVTIMANVLGELGRGGKAIPERAALLGRVVEALPQDGHLLIVEPGTRIHAQELVAVREILRRERGIHIWAPCVGSPACPLHGSKDWCHADMPASWPRAYVERAARAGIHAQALKYSYLWLARRAPPQQGPDLVRLIGGPMYPRPETLLRYACGGHGRVTLGQDGTGLGQGPLGSLPRGALYTVPPGVKTSQFAPVPKPPRGRHHRRS